MSEKVFIVVVDMKDLQAWPAEQQLMEMEELVTACGGETVQSRMCPTPHPHPATLIGSGTLEEIKMDCRERKVDTVVFSQDLKGSQQRNIEEILETKTIDRTQLILDIFARHARSQEGQMQVELAQLEYMLPRLVGKGIELSRLGGGIGTLGPGETKLEVDRRRIGTRIHKLKNDLKDVSASRRVKRKKRKDRQIPMVSLVGYTNAGKSTLLNTMTSAGQLTRDGMFTTLDSVSRQFILPKNQKVVISDTVGFMHQLPHHLIESFKATLEEVQEADLLLHVVDVSNPKFRDYIESVVDVLKELESDTKDTIIVLNKIDLMEDRIWLKDVRENFEDAVCISAATGEGMDDLMVHMGRRLESRLMEVDVHIPIDRMDLVNLAHQEGRVMAVKYYNDSIYLRGILPFRLAGQFLKHKIK